MTDTMSSALLIMIVGMLSVFTILSIIILGGNALIRIVNFGFKPKIEEPISTIPASHKVVISTVVHELTEGQAKDIKIEKI